MMKQFFKLLSITVCFSCLLGQAACASKNDNTAPQAQNNVVSPEDTKNDQNDYSRRYNTPTAPFRQ